MNVGGWIVEMDGIGGLLGGDELTVDVIFDCGDCMIGGEPWCCLDGLFEEGFGTQHDGILV